MLPLPERAADGPMSADLHLRALLAGPRDRPLRASVVRPPGAIRELDISVLSTAGAHSIHAVAAILALLVDEARPAEVHLRERALPVGGPVAGPAHAQTVDAQRAAVTARAGRARRARQAADHRLAGLVAAAVDRLVCGLHALLEDEKCKIGWLKNV